MRYRVPVFISSGPWAWRAPWKWFIDWHLIAGCVTKTTTFRPCAGNGALWRTIRPYRGGWINRMGLPNRGIIDAKAACMMAVSERREEKLILSVAAPDMTVDISTHLSELHVACPTVRTFELNLSCPSTHRQIDTSFLTDQQIDTSFLTELLSVQENPRFCHFRFILKVAITTPLEAIMIGVRYGAWLHVGNSVRRYINGQAWGLSGTPDVLEHNLDLVKKIRKTFPEVFIIAGGGIRSIQDGEKYVNAGANALSVGSVLLKRPWAANRIALAFS